MKRFLLALAVVLGLAVAPAAAATVNFYVDGGCTNDGDAAQCDVAGIAVCTNADEWVCAAAGAGPGPARNIQTAIDAAIATPGCATGDDCVIIVRGAHTLASHTVGTDHDVWATGSDVSFNGRYHMPNAEHSTYGTYRLAGLNGSAGHPVLIQPFAYGLAGEEDAFLEATAKTAVWTQCALIGGECDGVCANVPDSFCTSVWHTEGISRVGYYATLSDADPTPTYRVGSFDDMTNAHTDFVGTRCNGTPWMRCRTADDCPAGDVCGGSSYTSVERDSYTIDDVTFVGSECLPPTPKCSAHPTIPCYSNSDCPDYLTGETCDSVYQYTDNRLFVRWGSSVPVGAYPIDMGGYSAGNGFTVDNSTYVTIRGFEIRNTAKGGIAIYNLTGSANHIIFTDNRIFYATNIGGNDYGSHIDGGASLVFDVSDIEYTNNTIAYSASEAMHLGPNGSGNPLVFVYANNYVFGTGDKGVIGISPIAGQTPFGMIVGNYPTAPGLYGNADYSNSSIYNNVFGRVEHTLMNSPSAKGCYGGAGSYCADVCDARYGPNKCYCYMNSGLGVTFENALTGTSLALHDNVFKDNGGLALGCNGPSASNLAAYNNIFVNTHGDGAIDVVLASGCTTGLQGNTFFNNIVYNPQKAAFHLSKDPSLSDSVIAGNIIANNVFYDTIRSQVRMLEFFNTPQPSSGMAIHHNVFSAPLMGVDDTAMFYMDGTRWSCSYGLPDNTCARNSDGTRMIDPGFRNASSLDFRPLPYTTISSAGQPRFYLIDNGTGDGMPVNRSTGANIPNAYAKMPLTFPRMDEAVPQTGSEWDIGAFELRPANGGFETDAYSWGWSFDKGACTDAGPNGPTSPTSPVPTHGPGVFELYGRFAGDIGGSLLYSLTNLDTARTYTIRFKVWPQGGDGATADKALDVQIDNVSKCSINSNAQTWITMPGGGTGTCTFTPAGATAVLEFFKDCPAAGTQIYYIDDVEVIVSN